MRFILRGSTDVSYVMRINHERFFVPDAVFVKLKDDSCCSAH